MTETDNFKEFCEGWLDMRGRDRPYQRNELFTVDRLKEQFIQIQKAIQCNRSRGAVK